MYLWSPLISLFAWRHQRVKIQRKRQKGSRKSSKWIHTNRDTQMEEKFKSIVTDSLIYKLQTLQCKVASPVEDRNENLMILIPLNLVWWFPGAIVFLYYLEVIIFPTFFNQCFLKPVKGLTSLKKSINIIPDLILVISWAIIG